jgi:hypothetical protein
MVEVEENNAANPQTVQVPQDIADQDQFEIDVDEVQLNREIVRDPDDNFNEQGAEVFDPEEFNQQGENIQPEQNNTQVPLNNNQVDLPQQENNRAEQTVNQAEPQNNRRQIQVYDEIYDHISKFYLNNRSN